MLKLNKAIYGILILFVFYQCILCNPLPDEADYEENATEVGDDDVAEEEEVIAEETLNALQNSNEVKAIIEAAGGDPTLPILAQVKSLAPSVFEAIRDKLVDAAAQEAVDQLIKRSKNFIKKKKKLQEKKKRKEKKNNSSGTTPNRPNRRISTTTPNSPRRRSTPRSINATPPSRTRPTTTRRANTKKNVASKPTTRKPITKKPIIKRVTGRKSG